jgi:hypothetical protein
MKLLKIDDNCGHFRQENDEFCLIDKIGKDELLDLMNWTLYEDEVDFDDYDENEIKNQAHQIIYKSILRKLQTLRERRQEFIDESARLFLEDYEKYRENESDSNISQ